MMINEKKCILFHGLSGGREDFKERMVRLGAPPEIVDRMIMEAPVILKEDLSPGAAKRYANAVQEAGGRVAIQAYGRFKKFRRNDPVPIVSLKDFTRCPECGLKQQKGSACVKCGFNIKQTAKGK